MSSPGHAFVACGRSIQFYSVVWDSKMSIHGEQVRRWNKVVVDRAGIHLERR
jgi:hypothetical protein